MWSRHMRGALPQQPRAPRPSWDPADPMGTPKVWPGYEPPASLSRDETPPLPNRGAPHGLAARRMKGKTQFCALKRKLGLLFPWKRLCESGARAGPVGVAHKARTEPLPFTAPGNRLLLAGTPGLGGCQPPGQGALTAPVHGAAWPGCPRADPSRLLLTPLLPDPPALLGTCGLGNWCPETALLGQFCACNGHRRRARSPVGQFGGDASPQGVLGVVVTPHLAQQHCPAAAPWLCRVHMGNQAGGYLSPVLGWLDFTETSSGPTTPNPTLQRAPSHSITPEGGSKGAGGLSPSPLAAPCPPAAHAHPRAPQF
nr:nascent polypeptide-associated complex subunit alpha, muscle-specific form-like [Zonotrichia albicollis]